FKVLFFILVVLPVTIFLVAVFIIPLTVILLILSLFWSGKVFHFRTFRTSSSPSSDHGVWEEKNNSGQGEYVDVESTVVESAPAGDNGDKNMAALPENRVEQ
ncbi:MAG: hypothetical protein IKA79_02300, partial [Lentisphaeria bacterium]|nr:hypothetical protein [Lentisphaeria bacterium]